MPAGRLESAEPATGRVLGTVACTAPAELAGVVEAVAEVRPFWAQLPLAERARYLRRVSRVVVDEADAITELIAREQGRPRTEAYLLEVLPILELLRWAADRGPQLLAAEPVDGRSRLTRWGRAEHRFAPLGVVGVIAAYSAPWSMPLGALALSLLAGNGAILKPSSRTPFVAERVVHVLERAGVPEGLVRTVHGPGTGPALVEGGVVKVFFAGGVEAGRDVAARCGELLVRCVLELPGDDPMLVLRDAPLEHAVAGALWGAFANAGQGAGAVRRVYVVPEVAESFTAALAEGARRLRVGDPLAWHTEVGPLIDGRGVERMAAAVARALEQGCALEAGGQVPAADAAAPFAGPAVLRGEPPDREPVAGPLVSVVAVADEDEAVRRANDSPYGLGASVWTEDRVRGERLARELEAGMVWINDHGSARGVPQASWGGTKASGLGAVGGPFGLREHAQVRLVDERTSQLRDPWWHPYDETLARGMRELGAALYGREAGRLGALRRGVRPLARVAARMRR